MSRAPGPVLVTRAALVAIVVVALWLAPVAAQGPAVSPPVPTMAPVIGSGDSRSEGEGPGFVGSPVAIAVGVVVLGLATAIGTVVVLRVGGRRGG
jgi:hypothetical protein